MRETSEKRLPGGMNKVVQCLKGLKGIDEFDGEEAGLLGKVLSASPIAALAGPERLCEKASNLVGQILLRCA